jgi:hypothetical protein
MAGPVHVVRSVTKPVRVSCVGPVDLSNINRALRGQKDLVPAITAKRGEMETA